MSSLEVILFKRTAEEKKNVIFNLDGRVKFLLFIWASIIVYIFYDWILTLVFLTAFLAISLVGKVFKHIAIIAGIVIVPYMLVSMIVLGGPFGFKYNETVVFVLNLLGYRIPFYLEGLGWAVTWPLRIGVSVVAALIFFLTTPQARLIATLLRLKMPFKLVYMIIATLQFIPIFLSEIKTIEEAQKSRGLRVDVGIIRRFKNFFAMIIPLTMSVINKVQVRAIALESRGFRAPVEKIPYYDISLKKADKATLLIMIVVSILLVYLYVTQGLSPFAHLKYLLAGG